MEAPPASPPPFGISGSVVPRGETRLGREREATA